jgi:hypothetical protein
MNWRSSLMLGLSLLLSACGGLFEIDFERPTGTATPPGLTRAVGTMPFDTSVTPGMTTTLTLPAVAAISETPSVASPPPTDTATVCGPPSRWVRYTVQPGDTLFELGLHTNVSVQELQVANCLSATTIRVGQQLFLPYIPTPTFTPTLTPLPTPTLDPSAVWSPDGKRYATASGAVVDTERGRVATVNGDASPWLRFWRWTAEGRYAIFIRLNQYGNGQTIVFDIQAWQTILTTSGCAAPTSPCLEFPKALHPSTPRFLMADGRLVTLPLYQPLDLLAAWRPGTLTVAEAAWSPNGGYLLFVAGTGEPSGAALSGAALSGAALYFAQGDGTLVRQPSAPLQGTFRALAWASDGQTATVVTSTHLYTLEAATGLVTAVTPTPTATATPSATLTPGATP